MRKREKKTEAVIAQNTPESSAPEGIRCFHNIKHTFDSDERQVIVSELTRALDQVEELEARLKNVSSQIKSEVKSATLASAIARRKIQDGYEMRSVEALVSFDRKAGVKTFVRFSPGTDQHLASLCEEHMTEQDYQNLPLEPAIESESSPEE